MPTMPVQKSCTPLTRKRMHAIDGQLVGAHLIALPHETAGVNGSCFGNADKFQGQYAIHDEPPYLKIIETHI